MTTVDLITALFYEVDEQLRTIPKHPEAHLWPSEVVTLGLLHALKGGGNRYFYRWLTRDYRVLFPHLPERTRVFRLFQAHHDWTKVFLTALLMLGVIDTYGIENHPSDARGPEPAADRQQRRVEPPLDCRRQTLPAPQSMGVDRGVGVCHGQCGG